MRSPCIHKHVNVVPSLQKYFNSAFTLVIRYSTARHGMLNFASVNGYRSEPNCYVPGWPGPATSTVLARYGMAR